MILSGTDVLCINYFLSKFDFSSVVFIYLSRDSKIIAQQNLCCELDYGEKTVALEQPHSLGR